MNANIKQLMNDTEFTADEILTKLLCDFESTTELQDAWNAMPESVRQRLCKEVDEAVANFATVIATECKDISLNLALNYTDARLDTHDPVEKERLATGQAACEQIAGLIKERFTLEEKRNGIEI